MKSLYFVKAGALTVKIKANVPLSQTQLDAGDTDVIVAKMKDGDFFGESVFLSDAHQATASIIAESDEVVVNCITNDYVNMLFARHQLYAAKFYKFLGESIQRRLYGRIAERKGFDVSSFF